MIILGGAAVNYLLGFDASCATCTRTGERIRVEVGDRLAVVPLQSPEMSRHRKAVFGDAAQWAPTLVRVDGDKVDAWTGWRMGPALNKAIGLTSSIRILSIVGQEEPRARSRTMLRSMGRRPFFRFAAGAVLGAAALSGLSSPAYAGPLSGRRSTAPVLQGSAVPMSALELLSTPDATIAFAGFTTPQVLRGAAGTNPAKGHHLMSSVDRQAGTEHASTGVYDTGTGLLYVSQRRGPAGHMTESSAAVYQLSGDGSRIGLRSSSVNGARGDTVDQAALSEAVLAGQDPCGGCNGPGGPGDRSRRTTTRCVEDVDVACALALAGCVGCGASCVGATGPAIGLCAFCLVTSCGGFFAAGGCCSADGAVENVCFPCNPPL